MYARICIYLNKQQQTVRCTYRWGHIYIYACIDTLVYTSTCAGVAFAKVTLHVTSITRVGGVQGIVTPDHFSASLPNRRQGCPPYLQGRECRQGAEGRKSLRMTGRWSIENLAKLWIYGFIHNNFVICVSSPQKPHEAPYPLALLARFVCLVSDWCSEMSVHTPSPMGCRLSVFGAVVVNPCPSCADVRGLWGYPYTNQALSLKP